MRRLLSAVRSLYLMPAAGVGKVLPCKSISFCHAKVFSVFWSWRLSLLETMPDESVSEEDLKAVDVFTHSSTGFPGAWTEDEISQLLDAWEETVKSPRPFAKPFDVAEKVLNLLEGKGFREIEKDDVWKQMSTLRTEYRTYLGLVKIGIPTVKGSCVPQLERILRRPASRRTRRRRASTASNQAVSEDDTAVQNGSQSQPENTEDEAGRGKRVRFQRQNLQRSVRTMIAQQRTIMENLQNVFKKIDESNDKIILLLGELVALQKLPDKTDKD